MIDLRLEVGRALMRAAGVLAAAGRRIEGRPMRELVVTATQGDNVIHLSRGVPGFVRGLRLVGSETDEIRRVQRVSGDSVELDAPLVGEFPRGTKVKVLV